MLLKKLKVQNFGVFRGQHIFDLTPSLSAQEHKPIILFGGLNGTGKTTLFDSIKLCLYGRFFSSFKSQTVYDNYILNRVLPKTKETQKNYRGSIELEFDYSSFGQIQQYSVLRFWTVQSGKLTEELRILKDQKMLGPVESEYGQAFLMEFIPRELLNLFFFDGEKIQTLANDTKDNENFRSIFDSVLGIDIINRLKNDLKIYQSRIERNNCNAEIDEKIRSLEINENEYEIQLETLYQKIAQKKSELDHVKSQIELKEIELLNQGGGYAAKRSMIREEIVIIDNEILEMEKNIQELCSALFPFSLIPDLCKELRNRLEIEQKQRNQIIVSSILKENWKKFEERINSLSELILPKKEIDVIFSQMKDIFNETFIKDTKKELDIIHDISDANQIKILSWIEQSLNFIPQQMIEYTKKLEDATFKRRNLGEMLEKAPSDEILNPIINDINLLNRDYGELNKEIERMDEEIRINSFKLDEIKRKLQKSLDEKNNESAFDRRLKLLKSVQVTLKDFIMALRMEKTKTLSENFVECMNLLLNKEDFISNISIDPESYSINLARSNGAQINKDDLSAGEKQIYAIAMLMSLARISGFPLPFIIDTPLARLDSLHRQNIVTRFFPYASHQVIIFSTDTEIDEIYFDELMPFLSKIYHLSYDSTSSSVKVEEGYFWKKEAVNYEFSKD